MLRDFKKARMTGSTFLKSVSHDQSTITKIWQFSAQNTNGIYFTRGPQINTEKVVWFIRLQERFFTKWQGNTLHSLLQVCDDCSFKYFSNIIFSTIKQRIWKKFTREAYMETILYENPKPFLCKRKVIYNTYV